MFNREFDIESKWMNNKRALEFMGEYNELINLEFNYHEFGVIKLVDRK